MSLSLSPAPGPWGMPFFVADAAPDEDDVLVAADPPEELEDPVEAGAAGVLDELDEFPPQAATPSATSTIASGTSRRIVLGVSDFMNRSFISFGMLPVTPVDARKRMVVPGTVPLSRRRAVSRPAE